MKKLCSQKTSICLSSSFKSYYLFFSLAFLSACAENFHLTAPLGGSTSGTATVAAGAVPVTGSNCASYGPIGGTCSPNGQTVTVDVGGIAPSPQPTCSGGTWSVASMNLCSLPAGPTIITATVGSGTPASGTVNVGVGSTSVAVTSTNPDINAANEAAYGPVSGTCSEAGENVTVAFVDSASTTITVSPAPVCTASNTWTIPAQNLSTLLDGPVNITADHCAAGGTPCAPQAVDNLLKDTIPPPVGPIAITPSNPGPTNDTGVDLLIDCGIDAANGTAVVTTVAPNGFTPQYNVPLPLDANGQFNINSVTWAHGSWQVSADCTDAAGNGPTTGPTTPPTVIIDTNIPTVAITAPASGSLINAANQTSFPVSGTCSEPGQNVSINGTSGTIIFGQPIIAVCSGSNTWTANLNFIGSPDGPVNISADHSDAAGNPALQDTENFVLDTGLPAVAITSTNPDINAANEAAYGPVSGTCSEPGEDVVVTFVDSASNTITVAPNPVCTASNTWSAPAQNLSTLLDGAVNINANHSDAAGNPAPQDTDSLIKDTVPPPVAPIAVTPSNPGPTNDTGVDLLIDCGIDAANGTVVVTTVAPNGFTPQYNVPLMLDPNGQINLTGITWGNGSWQILTDCTDAAGNGPTSGPTTPPTVAIDTNAPTVVINALAAITSANETSYNLSGTCTEAGQNVDVELSDGSVQITQTVVCSGSNTWSITGLNVVSLADGTITVTADHDDVAGNTDQDVATTTNNSSSIVNVAITSTNPDINAANEAAYGPVSGTCSEAGENVTVAFVDSASTTITVSPAPVCTASNTWTIPAQNLSTLLDGPVNITADHCAAGGTPCAPQAVDNLLKDTLPPPVGPIAITPSNPGPTNDTSVDLLIDCGVAAAGGTAVVTTVAPNGFTPQYNVPLPLDANGQFNINSVTWAHGSWQVSADCTDAAGNGPTTGPTTPPTVIIDTNIPTVAITAPASGSLINAANQTSFPVSGTCSEPGQNVSINGTSGTIIFGQPIIAVCSGSNTWTANLNFIGSPDGPVNISADHSDAAGNPALQDTENFVLDTGLPAVAITSTNPDINAANEAAYGPVSGTCSEPGEDVVVTFVDSASNTITVAPNPVCTASNTWSAPAQNLSTLLDGAVNINANHSDAAGNPAPQDTDSLIKDTVPPPVAPIAVTPSNPGPTNDTGVDLLIDCGIDAANGTVVVTTVAPNGFTPQYNVPLMLDPNGQINLTGITWGNGSWQILTDCTDAAGNGPTSGPTTPPTVAIDTNAPTVVINALAAITSANETSYNLSGTCTEAGQNVDVELSDGSVQITQTVVCSGSNTWSITGLNVVSLADGTITVTADHDDVAGNTDQDVATTTNNSSSIVNVAITSTNPDINAANEAAYGPVSGTCSEAGENVTVAFVDSASTTITVSPAPVCTASNTWTIPAQNLSTLLDGPVNITADHCAAGGTPCAPQAVDNLLKDTLPPPVGPIAITPSNPGPTNDTSVDLLIDCGVAAAGGTAVVTTVAPNGFTPQYNVPLPLDANGQFNINSVTWAHGSWQVSADCTDAAGNGPTTGPTTPPTVIIDTNIPTVAITAPASGSLINAANQTSFPVSGTCSEPGQNVSINGTSGTIIFGQPIIAVCSGSNTWTANLNFIGSPDGPVNISADHSDAAGNPALQDTENFVLDTGLPAVAITSTNPDINAANEAAYGPVSGTCSEPGEDVVVTFVDSASNTITVAPNPVCTASNTWSAPAQNLSTLLDGAVNINANHSDAAGNPAPQDTDSLIKDTVPPPVAPIAVTPSNPGPTNDTGVDLLIDCGIDAANGTVVVTTVAPNGFTPQYNVPLMLDPNGQINLTGITWGNGSWQILTDCTDAAGNGPTSGPTTPPTVAIDTNAPTVVINALAAITSANETSYNLSGTCTEAGQNVDVELSDGSVQITQTVVCSGSNTWSITGLNVVSLADGTITVTADHDDVAGNTDQDVATTTNNSSSIVNVAITSTNPDINAANEAAYGPVSGTCSEAGENVTVAFVDSASTTITVSPAPVCTASNTWTIPAQNLSTLLDGPVNITADHCAAGGTPCAPQAVDNLLKDTLPPPVGPIAITPSNPGPTNDTSVDLLIDCGVAAAGGTAVVTTVAPNGFTPQYNTPLTLDANGQINLTGITWAHGSWQILTDCTDAAGNGPTSGPSTPPTVIIDTNVPTVVITAPASGSLINAANQTSFPVSGTCSEPGQNVSINGTSGTIIFGQPIIAVCSGSNTWTANLNFIGSPDGPVNISADHIDAAGNPALQDTENFVLDTGLPAVAITSTNPDINAANEAAYGPVSGTCSEPGEDVVVTFVDSASNTITVSPNPVCTASNTWSAPAQNLSTLLDGAVNINANHSDAAGNPAPQDTDSLIKDTVPPPVAPIAVTPSNPGPTNDTGVDLLIDCGIDAANGTVVVTTVAPNGFTPQYNVPLMLDPNGQINLTGITWGNGSWQILTDCTDAAGNGPTSGPTTPPTVAIDTNAPTVVINALAAITSANETSYNLSGTCTEAGQNVDVELSDGSVQITQTVVCSGSNTWSITGLNVVSLADGTITVTADHDDVAGNTDQDVATTTNNSSSIVNVAITSTNPDINAANEAAYGPVSGTCSEAGENVTVAFVDSASTTITVSPAPVCTASNTWTIPAQNLSTLLDGPVNITADHCAAGGTPCAPQAVDNLLKDTLPPPVGPIAITPSNPGPTNDTSVDLLIDCGVAAAGGTAVVTTVAPNGFTPQYNVPLPLDANGQFNINSVTWAHGSWQVSADCTDAAGNGPTTGPTTPPTVIIDTNIPTVAITAPASGSLINAANQTSFPVSGTCSEPGQNVSINGTSGTIIFGQPIIAVCSGSNTWTANLNFIGSPDGPVNISADHSDAAGNPALQDTENFVLDTGLPAVAITSTNPDINAANEAAYGPVSGTCSEPGEDVVVTFVDSASNTITVAPNPVCTASNTWSAPAQNLSTLLDGAVNINANHSDAAGNPAPQDTDSLIKDTVPPPVAPIAVTPSNPGPTNDTGVDLLIDCGIDAANGTVVVTTVAPNGFTPQYNVPLMLDPNGQINLTGITWGNGSWQILTDCTDAAGNGPTSGPTTPPTVAIDTNAPTVVINALAAITSANETSYNLSGTCTEAGQNVDVELSDGSVQITQTVVCSGSNTWSITGLNVVSLADGTITVTADHDDVAGNTDQDVATTTNNSSSIVNVAITSTNPDINAANEAAYGPVSGTCSEAGENVTVAFVDSASTTITVSPAPVCTASNTWTIPAQNLSTLLDGPVNITADHCAAGGTPCAPQAVDNLLKDTLPPPVGPIAITPSNPGPTNDTSVDLLIDCGVAAAGGTAVVTTVAPNGFTPQYNVPLPLDANGQFNINSVTWAHGSWQVSADCTDAAGNGPTTGPTTPPTVIIDTNIPTVAITAPASGSLINAANQTSFPVSGTCSEPGQNVSINGTSGTIIFGQPIIAVCSGSNTWTANLNFIGSPDGPVNISADHSDAAGNPALQDTENFVLDTGLPAVAITSTNPDINAANEAAYGPVSGTCSEPGEDVVVTFVDSASNTITVAPNPVCTASNTWSAPAQNLSTLLDGAVNINANHSDAAGNPAPQDTDSLIKDTGLPMVAISAPSSGSYVNASDASNFQVTGTCTEIGENVNVSGVSPTTVAGSPVTVLCAFGGTWSATIDVSANSDGPINIAADHSDAAGNPASQATENYILDTSAPLGPVAITPSNSGPTNDNSVDLLIDCGTSAANGTVVVTTVAANGFTPQYNVPLTLDASGQINLTSVTWADGSWQISADCTDAAGNGPTSGPATPPTVVIDTTIPTVAITAAAPIDATNETTYATSGTCSEPGEDVVVVLTDSASNSITVSPNPVCTSTNTWSVTGLNVSSLVAGTVAITADHTDAAGNNAIQAVFNTNKSTGGGGGCTNTIATTVEEGGSQADPATSLPIMFDVVFASAIDASTFIGSDISFSGTAPGTPAYTITNPSSDNMNFRVAVTGLTGTGTVVISLAAGVTANTAGTDCNLASTSSDNSVQYNPSTGSPTVAFSSPASGSTVYAAATLTGTCSEVGENVSVSGVSPAVLPGQPLTANCSASGTWVLSGVDTSGLANGPFSVTADHCASGGTPCAPQATLALVKSSSNPPDCSHLYAGGTGSAVDPFQVADVYGLQCITWDLDAHYVLINNIDASPSSAWTWTWWNNTAENVFPFAGEFDPCGAMSPPYNVVGTTGDGFLPIGSLTTDGSVSSMCGGGSGYPELYVDPFIGELDGNNYTIDGLFIDRQEELTIGLFAALESTALIKDLNLDNFNINADFATTSSSTPQYGSALCVNASSEERQIGGLIGCADFSGLSSTHTFLENVNWLGGTVNYDESSSSTTSGGSYLGHIIGILYNGQSFARMNDIEVRNSTYVSNGLGGLTSGGYFSEGALAGSLNGAVLDNILVDSTTMDLRTNSSAGSSGGFVSGGMIGQAQTTSLSNIVFNGTTICPEEDNTTSSYSVCAGFVGSFSGNAQDISANINFRPTSMDSSGSSSTGLSTGGVFGEVTGGTVISDVEAVAHWVDLFGVVDGDGTGSSTYDFAVGGFIGEVNATSTSTVLVERVSLDMSIDFSTHGSTAYYLGGFLGEANTATVSNLTINDSYVWLDLQSASSSMMLLSFGGFVGNSSGGGSGNFTVNDSYIANIGNDIHVSDFGTSTGYGQASGFSYEGVINNSFADVSIVDTSTSGTPFVNAFCEACTPTNAWFYSTTQNTNESYGVAGGGTSGHPQIFEATASTDFYDIHLAPMTSWDFTASGAWDSVNDDIDYPILK